MKLLSILFLAALIGFRHGAMAEDEKIVPKEPVNVEVPVHVGKITRATLHSYVTAYGTVEPEPATKDKPAASARVASPFSGMVIEASCYEGQQVKKGDLLFRLDGRTAEVAVKKAQQTVAFAEQNFERQKKLLKIEGTSQKNYQQAEQDFNTERSELTTAETQAKLLSIEAPLSGTIVRSSAKPGEAVDVNSVLAEIIDLERLVVTANVPGGEVSALKTGALAKISSGATAVPGKVNFIGSNEDSKTGTVLVRVSISPDSHLRPGQFVNLLIISDEHKDCLVVPVESVVKNEEGKTLIHVVEGDKAIQKIVTTGLRENKLVEVEGEGLKEGTPIVTTGAYGLPAETKIRVVAE